MEMNWHDKAKMFGKYHTDPNSGVNPPWSPAYPVEWGCQLRTLQVMTRVDPKKIEKLFAMGKPKTPFELVNDRVAFQFMLSPDHSMSYHNSQMFDLMVTVPVRYAGLLTQTHIYMWTADVVGILAGREVCGYTKKDCTYEMLERTDGCISGWVNRRGFPIADFKFTPDPTAPVVNMVDGDEQPAGEIHVRRIPHPEKLDTVYSDIVYRRTPLEYAAPVPGRVEMNLYGSEYDPVAELEPEILSAQWLVSGIYGGGFEVEDRRLIEQLIP